MSDDELIRIATRDAYGLTPEAMEVVKAEIQKRGLDQNIAKGVEAYRYFFIGGFYIPAALLKEKDEKLLCWKRCWVRKIRSKEMFFDIIEPPFRWLFL